MKKEYVLIENRKYKVILSFEEIDFDYYTNVSLEFICQNKSIIIFRDNLLALKNAIDWHYENIDELDTSLDENKLGILLNNYYGEGYEKQSQDGLNLDNQGRWIGEKYCCFLSHEYASWIYRKHENIIVKVTPVFCGYEKDDYIREYNKFLEEYNDTFREMITPQELHNMKRIVFELCNELL